MIYRQKLDFLAYISAAESIGVGYLQPLLRNLPQKHERYRRLTDGRAMIVRMWFANLHRLIYTFSSGKCSAGASGGGAAP